MRPALSLHAAERRLASRPLLERLLASIGADPRIVESVLGDLEEERAERAARDGAARARLWHLREASRSMPWLLSSGLRRAGWRGRDIAAASGGMLALLATAVAMLLLTMAGAPAQLLPLGDNGDGILVNNVTPVRLPVRVLDARGHVLPDTAVRYRWAGGLPVLVTPRGVIKCDQRGDAIVRATLGDVATDLSVRCRPVLAVLGASHISLIVGRGSAHLPFVALDPAGRIEKQLRGEITVANSEVAGTLPGVDGHRLVRARSMGTTRVEVKIGDRSTDLFVDAYRRATTPTGIAPGDQVAVPVTIQPGTLRWWRLSPSRQLYRVKMLADGDPQRAPMLSIYGANCVEAGPQAFLCAAPRGATVFAYYPAWDQGGESRHGDLAVGRDASN